MSKIRRGLLLLFFGALVTGLVAPESASANRSRLKRFTKGVTIKDRLGHYIYKDLGFTDHTGKKVRLRHFFDGKRPVILTLNYYGCKTLCNVQLAEFTKSLKGLDWKPGSQYRVVTISINPKETPADAREMRKNLMGIYGQKNVDWTFMVGKPSEIRRIANEVGFHYRYDSKTEQYIHVPAVFFLSSSGRLTRFLHGLKYPTRSMKFALMEASEGRIGTVTDRLYMSCFHFNPEDGTYSATAFGVMRLVGVSVALILGLVLVLLWVMDRFVWRKGEAS